MSKGPKGSRRDQDKSSMDKKIKKNHEQGTKKMEQERSRRVQ